MMETAAVVAKKIDALYINILAQITPECDCMPQKLIPFTRDIGILIGTDPVAIDVASADILRKYASERGDETIEQIYPNVPYRYGFEYAEKLGTGNRNYRIVRAAPP